MKKKQIQVKLSILGHHGRGDITETVVVTTADADGMIVTVCLTIMTKYLDKVNLASTVNLSNSPA
jgi:hypothetical protein